MRAHLHARRTVSTADAQVALGGQVDPCPRFRAVVLDTLNLGPRAPAGAVAAPAAGGSIDHHLHRAERPRDRAGWTADHADRVGALIAGARHAEVPEARSLAHEARNPGV